MITTLERSTLSKRFERQKSINQILYSFSKLKILLAFLKSSVVDFNLLKWLKKPRVFQNVEF